MYLLIHSNSSKSGFSLFSEISTCIYKGLFFLDVGIFKVHTFLTNTKILFYKIFKFILHLFNKYTWDCIETKTIFFHKYVHY